MTAKSILASIVALTLGTVGCAGMGLESDRGRCAAIGGLLGGVAGAVVAHNGDEHETDEELAGAGIGAAAGAALGALLCGDTAPAAPQVAPSARIDVNPADGEAPLRAAFAASVTPQSDELRSYSWDFGDGSSGEGERVTHTYEAPGSYNARVTISNRRGSELSASARVLVRAEAPERAAEPPAAPATERRIVLRGVRFAPGSAVIAAEDEALLEIAVEQLRPLPDVRVQITGHTDSDGTETMNQALSERRARAVLEYLARSGIARGRLSAAGRGESAPLATNDTEAGRAENRRVELDVIE